MATRGQDDLLLHMHSSNPSASFFAELRLLLARACFILILQGKLEPKNDDKAPIRDARVNTGEDAWL